MEFNLTIGDKASDSSLIVLDEDRLCYSVRSISKGVSGIRTISKALLSEWVDAYKQSPEASAQVVREQLVGKSDIDRFEYGYASTLAKMAKMVLGLNPIIHTINKIDYKKEFIEWWCNIKKQGRKCILYDAEQEIQELRGKRLGCLPEESEGSDGQPRIEREGVR